MSMKVAIAGAGSAGKFLYDEIIERAINIDVIGFIDNFLKGEYKGKKIYPAKHFFDLESKRCEKVDAIFIAVGAQKTLKFMIDMCKENGVENIYVMHDIVGKCHLTVFDEKGMMIERRIRKLKFSEIKPSLAYFEVPITESCNLNCKGCLFASNITKGTQHINLDELIKDAKRMAELFYDVPWIRILGGEPLMHPNIVEVLKCYRQYFPDSEIDLCTNGLLLHQMRNEFWECIKNEKISIHISGYKPTYQMLGKIERVMEEQGIPYVILKRDEFVKYYTDKPDNDMQKSFNRCIASGCYEVYRGRLSTCSAAIAFEKFNEMFGARYNVTEDEDWFDIHKSDIDAWELKKKLEKPSFICRYCSDSNMEKFMWEYSGTRQELKDYIL